MKNLFVIAISLLVCFLSIGIIGCGSEGAEPTPTVTPTPTDDETRQADIGDTVKVHYTGSLGNGTVFDSSVGREPLEFTLGQGQMIQGFEKAVLGMSVGESKTVTIPSAEAYGPYRDDLVAVIDKDNLPPDWEPEVGIQYSFTQPDGGVILATVTEITDSTVTIDANHRLVGKDLTFEIELVDIIN